MSDINTKQNLWSIYQTIGRNCASIEDLSPLEQQEFISELRAVADQLERTTGVPHAKESSV